MLFPHSNRCRTVLDLSGFWEITIDGDDTGKKQGWREGFIAQTLIGVPGSWNEQLSEMGMMNYLGAVWYQTRFYVPAEFSRKTLLLRFGSVDFNAVVWINGEAAGSHQGGYFPFEFDITQLVKPGRENLLVVRVDNRLSHDSIPQGISTEDFAEFNNQRIEPYPPTVFDFFAYGGIHRPVKLIALSPVYVKSIKTETSLLNDSGRLMYEVQIAGEVEGVLAQISLRNGACNQPGHQQKLVSPQAQGEFHILDCRPWSPEDPHLYRLHVALLREEHLIDEYELEIGIRQVKISDREILLNGKPVFLKGFGKHEDFDVLGKGLSHPLIVKDFQLLKWIGANSFRTTHYPYAEEILQMADRLGFLVIDEVPAVSLNFKYVTGKTLENHKKALTALIERDRNHACVIAWSIANEPGIWGEPEALSEKAEKYWEEIYRHTKSLDNSRPITLPTCPRLGERDPGYTFSDFISVNRYWGWYEIPGDLEKAGAHLKAELENLYEKYRKPILVSEFGADTIEGLHATYPQLFTEEYQAEFLETYFKIIAALPFTVGEHIWNFADFRTAQHHRRVVLNKKGVFTRNRQPKTAAFAVRKHWLKK